MTAEVFRILFYDNLLPCESPRHKEHLRNIVRKHPKSDGKYPLIDMDPEQWASSRGRNVQTSITRQPEDAKTSRNVFNP